MRAWWLVTSGLAVVVACADFTTTPVAEPADGGPDGTPEPSPRACESGARIAPLSVEPYLGTLESNAAPQAVACGSEQALVADGTYAGLDRLPDGARAYIGDVAVAGCVAARFADEVVLGDIDVRVGPLANACDASPCTADPEVGCNSAPGLQVLVFSGPSLDALGNYRQIRFNTIPAEYSYKASPGSHVVVACRGGVVAVTRDDVGIDAIQARCP